MKIPTDPVPPAINTSGRANELRKAQPVRYASETGYEMSHPAPNEARDESAGAPDRRQAPRGGSSTPPGQAGAFPSWERRKEERRRANNPVLLDTRLQQIRRRKAEASKISLKI